MRLVLLCLLFAACTTEPLGGVQGAVEGCIRDVDCKGSRVCIDDKCSDPNDLAAPIVDMAPALDLYSPPDFAPQLDMWHPPNTCFGRGGTCTTRDDCCLWDATNGGKCPDCKFECLSGCDGGNPVGAHCTGRRCAFTCVDFCDGGAPAINLLDCVKNHCE